MSPSFRNIPLDEIRNFFAPHHVYDNGHSYVIHPYFDHEERTVLDIPKTLPVDRNNRLINVTAAMPVENLLEISPELDEKVFIRLGTAISTTQPGNTPTHNQIPYKLRLGQPKDADAIAITHCYTVAPFAWSTHRELILTDSFRDHSEILISQHIPQGIYAYDFYLIRCTDRHILDELRQRYISWMDEYVASLS